MMSKPSYGQPLDLNGLQILPGENREALVAILTEIDSLFCSHTLTLPRVTKALDNSTDARNVVQAYTWNSNSTFQLNLDDVYDKIRTRFDCITSILVSTGGITFYIADVTISGKPKPTMLWPFGTIYNFLQGDKAKVPLQDEDEDSSARKKRMRINESGQSKDTIPRKKPLRYPMDFSGLRQLNGQNREKIMSVISSIDSLFCNHSVTMPSLTKTLDNSNQIDLITLNYSWNAMTTFQINLDELFIQIRKPYRANITSVFTSSRGITFSVLDTFMEKQTQEDSTNSYLIISEPSAPPLEEEVEEGTIKKKTKKRTFSKIDD